MKRTRWTPILMLLAAPVVAAPNAVKAPPPPAAAKPFVDDDSLYDAPGRTVFARHRATPFRAQVAGEEAASRARVADLSARMARASEVDAPALAREIDAAKRAHDVRLVEIRLERARVLGSANAVSKLEARLRDLRAGVKGGR